MRGSIVTTLLLAYAATGAPAHAQWVEFEDQTAKRLVAEEDYGTADLAEKDFAYGDIDQDGDIDLIVVRKQPFSSSGKRVNRLFLNEDGVLVDRTSEYAMVADLPGDLGFGTPTNDRDVRLADLNGDGWLDVVTAVTISDGDSKAVGHPRVYLNLGNTLTGDWRGLRFEEARIPELRTLDGEPGFNPRFCGVGVGDLTEDGKPDLYFSDYDSGQFGPPESPGADFDDRLLVNDGTGHFTDETTDRLRGQITPPGFPPQDFEVSEFGPTAEIADLNHDGRNDIIKITTLVNPLMVAVAYYKPSTGFFDTYQTLDQHAPYFFSLGDLNNDGRLDVVISDDGTDRYLLNQRTLPNGTVDFKSITFSYAPGLGDAGFNNNSRIEDLNNDGWNDVVIAGMDVDFPNCGTRMNIYRNLGGTPGGDVALQEQSSGTDCGSIPFTDQCLIGGIPVNELTAVFDVAVFDIDGDGWKDMVLGKCSGTQVWMNVPPTGLVFAYPVGLPAFITPGEAFVFQAAVQAVGTSTHLAGSGMAWLSVGGGPFEPIPTASLGDDLYEITIPAIETCGTHLRFYLTAETEDGETYTDPPAAPVETFTALVALGTAVTWVDDIEGDVSDWSVVVDPTTTAGVWEAVEPIGAIDGFGHQSAPEGDAEGAADKTMAWVTQNPASGEGASDHDVDGGPIDLISPPLQAAGDAFVHFQRWFYRNTQTDRKLQIAARSSPDDDWTHVKDIVHSAQSWQPDSFRVGEFIEPSGQVQVRFRIDDTPRAALVEGGVDVLRIERFVCTDCESAVECDDGVFCNGIEACVVGSCLPGPAVCAGEVCDEGLDACLAPPAAGQIPDGVLPGEPLRVARTGGDAVRLDWGVSCVAADTDYAVYSGPLGQFAESMPVTCTTEGQLGWNVAESGDRYFLVVPANAWREGSYGFATGGQPRSASPNACLPQAVGTCAGAQTFHEAP